MNHRTLFPGFLTDDEDRQLAGAGLKDCSWGNDAFPIWGCPDEPDNRRLLATDHPVPSERELPEGRRFTLFLNDDQSAPLYETDNLDHALAAFWFTELFRDEWQPLRDLIVEAGLRVVSVKPDEITFVVDELAEHRGGQTVVSTIDVYVQRTPPTSPDDSRIVVVRDWPEDGEDHLEEFNTADDLAGWLTLQLP